MKENTLADELVSAQLRTLAELVGFAIALAAQGKPIAPSDLPALKDRFFKETSRSMGVSLDMTADEQSYASPHTRTFDMTIADVFAAASKHLEGTITSPPTAH